MVLGAAPGDAKDMKDEKTRRARGVVVAAAVASAAAVGVAVAVGAHGNVVTAPPLERPVRTRRVGGEVRERPSLFEEHDVPTISPTVSRERGK